MDNKLPLWATSIRAIDPLTGELTTWCGPHIPAPSAALAAEYCQLNGLGYCKVEGQLIAEVETKEDGITPDWDTYRDYDNQKN